MWQEIFTTLGLLLVFEGIFPFLSPGSYREALLKVAQANDTTLRFLGLTIMLVGVGLLYWIR